MFMSTASIGVKITIWLIGVLGLSTLFNAQMIKVLNVDKKILFSNDYVNGIQKKIESFLSISFTITTIAMSFNNVSIPYFLNICIGYLTLLFGIRAIFEKKYAENPKDYLYTLSEFGFLMVSLFVMTYLIFPEHLSFK